MQKVAAITILMLVAAVRLSADDATLQLTLSGNKLSASSTTPTVSPGQKLRIVVPNVTLQSGTTWTMRMSGGSDMPGVAAGGGVTFEGTVPNSASGNLPVTFDDSSGTVTLNNSPLMFKVGTGGGGGTTTTSAPVAGNALIEQGFRPTYEQANDFVNLYFNSAGMLVHGDIPRDIDDNDAFRFYVYGTADEAASILVEVQGTLSSAGDFNILGSGSLSSIADLAGKIQAAGLAPNQPAIYRLGTFGPFASPSITVTVSKVAGTTKTQLRQYPIRINPTYLAAYRLLGAKSDLRYNSYTAAPVSGKTGNFIQNTAAEGGDMRYFLTIVPYAWGFRGSDWRGRDPAKQPLWYQRFNPMMGIGIKNAGKEYVLGVSVEVARGFDIVWARHRAKVATLAGGFNEGDAFTGAANTIPTVDKTASETVFGVSLDLRVATQMIGSLFK